MSGNEIRRGRQKETGEIMNLISKCVQVMQAGGSDQWDEHYPNREVITEDINKGTLFVLAEGEAIAGIIVLDENQAQQYGAIEWKEQQGPQLIMHRLAVHPEIQGKGIARRLIAFAEEFARSGGYSSIRLDTYAKNSRALKLYPALGYAQRGEIHFPGRTAAFPVFEKVLA
ncbi:GNAT family N-acetyltransferase [Paenibacillus sp. MMS20-IR301]|uniref:GNAT family N-acetyltransferase n=1 Tax=Paenibacillus sp. MMS20-IR301 TaxID=2895946 RepID=UPI0028EC9110|nr:GNAT family N-acetyltransferase [Paenibacillus sp. MMS20-IR301]WNS43383.1 GNAT family N-acetyltransferase [Paenibacillus sp. MMS20-IR301]